MELLCFYVTETLLLLFSLIWLLWNPMNCSPPSSSVRGTFQARIQSEPFPSPEDLADPEIQPAFALLVHFLPLSHVGGIYRDIGISQIGNKLKLTLSSLVLIQDNFFPFQYHPPQVVVFLIYCSWELKVFKLWYEIWHLSWVGSLRRVGRRGWDELCGFPGGYQATLNGLIERPSEFFVTSLLASWINNLMLRPLPQSSTAHFLAFSTLSVLSTERFFPLLSLVKSSS